MNRRNQIDQLLLDHPDGLTRPEMAEMLGVDRDTIYSALSKLPLAYIDRWTVISTGANGQAKRWVPVYCRAEVPPDAPMPDLSPAHAKEFA
jgi:predicted DNA-binding transcriptional regulator YafY